MEIQIRKKYVDLVIKKKHDIELHYNQMNEIPEKKIKIKISEWSDDAIKDLCQIANQNLEDSNCKNIISEVEDYYKLKDNPSGVKISRLINAEAPIKEYIWNTPHHWLFKKHEDKKYYPYFVKTVKYVDKERYSAPHISISGYYIDTNTENSFSVSFYKHDVKGKTVKEILEAKHWYIESEEIFKDYEKDLSIYREYSSAIGEQFLGANVGVVLNSRKYNWRSEISLNKEGVSAKLVVDTDLSGEEKTYANSYYNPDEEEDDDDYGRSKNKKKNKKSKEEEEDFVPMLPIHLFVKCFYLQEHIDVKVHVRNMTPYVYNEKVGDKLILPAETKDLIDIMLQGTKDLLEDIVTGKKGGIIVLATGEAGTGKTLTAEVYSEIIKRPLYVVPSHQLGLTIDDLEKNLQEILSRASRWKAILLIDEADVYIHERGDDIRQNAIVGIFLRVLEYYNGILFMTSNRATIIDDAILSRATAHIRYEKPNEEELRKIIKVLSDQFQVKMDENLINECVKEFTGISGRDVKNLLKLTRLLSIRREKPVDIEMLKFATKFQDFSIENNKAK